MQSLTLELPMTYSGVYMLFYLGSYGINVLSANFAMLVACKSRTYAVNICYQYKFIIFFKYLLLFF